MAALNLSTNGPSITKSYQSIVNAGPPTGPAANSPSYGQWAIFSVSAPLVNAFQQDAGGKESVLKVQTNGEGELVDLIDEFSDGRVQFAFVKVKDPNTGLPKSAFIGWCGEGVPERTKGYFTSHLNAVSKLLHGYHVQITARSDRDLTPEGIVQKISDASGSKYSASSSAQAPSGGPPPPVSSKPAFMPTRSGGAGSGFNPLSSRAPAPKPTNVDEDGWGEDAPQVTRSQLEKVQPAYQPTKVNMRELSSKQEPSRFTAPQPQAGDPDVVRGGYQPIGKVDIGEIRRQAQAGGKTNEDRPAPVKGSYEPVGKIDIAAIRARAQQPSGSTASPPTVSPAATGDTPRPTTSSFGGSERLTSLPKPKVVNKFGAGTSAFTGTKPPAPGGFGSENTTSPKPPVGASRTFADEGGKTPAQIWAEKKAAQGGGASATPASGGFGGPVSTQKSGNEGWKSGYMGKSWAAVETTKTGQSAASVERQSTGARDEPEEPAVPPSGGVSAMKDMFKGAPPMGAAATGAERSAPSPPPLETSTKPNASRGLPIPGLSAPEDRPAPSLPTPPPQPRSPTPPTPAADEGSPIRVAMPVSSQKEPEVEDAHEEQFSPPPALPGVSLAKQAAQHDEPDGPERQDIGRAAGANVAASSFGQGAADPSAGTVGQGQRALIQYDYEKAEDNELELVEGDYVTNIEMVDEDWWMGQNSRGETGLFPSNYVELVEDDVAGAGASAHAVHQPEPVPEPTPAPAAAPAATAGRGKTATALYDYEAAEDNELTFPEDATITNVEFPDDDWWSGEYNGKEGLFPANYVQLNQ